MKQLYKAILFSLDGDDTITDFRGSDSVDSVIEKLSDMGSKWIFYPYAIVVTDDGRLDYRKRALSVPDILGCLKGKTVKTIKNVIKHNKQVLADMM